MLFKSARRNGTHSKSAFRGRKKNKKKKKEKKEDKRKNTMMMHIKKEKEKKKKEKTKTDKERKANKEKKEKKEKEKEEEMKRKSTTKKKPTTKKMTTTKKKTTRTTKKETKDMMEMRNPLQDALSSQNLNPLQRYRKIYSEQLTGRLQGNSHLPRAVNLNQRAASILIFFGHCAQKLERFCAPCSQDILTVTSIRDHHQGCLVLL